MHFYLPPIQDIPQFTPLFEVRTRFERRADRDFLELAPDFRKDNFLRARAGFDWKFDEKTTARFQYQFSFDQFHTPTGIGRPHYEDVLLANLEHKSGDSVVTVGRQRLILGDERLIGALEWGNFGRTYDVLRVKNKSWDFFAGKLGVNYPRAKDVRLGAVSYTGTLGTTSLIYKHDEPAAGDTDHFTLDHIWKKSNGAWGYEFEGAYQFGDFAGLDHQAWALHGAASYKVDSKLRWIFEVNAASGGSTPGKSRTFDNLYPTNHKFYGIMDMFAWMNMTEIALIAEVKANSKLDFKASARSFALQNSKDAWYGAGGAPNRRVGGGIFRDVTGAAGREVGLEFDLDATLRPDKYSTVQAGIATFLPGPFVESFYGDSADAQVWYYLMVNWKW